ncbi:MAG: DUF6378 domain-containing protein [Hyphomicrobium sp.]
MKSNENPTSLLEQFDVAYSNVTADRRDVYGAPEDTYRRISTMRTIVDECPDPQIREILAMIVTKVARLVQTPDHLDSWVDVAGYSRCGVMMLDERRNGSREIDANGQFHGS